jgi:inhibitor of KinA sporulation pathway (predicted exonuclease)
MSDKKKEAEQSQAARKKQQKERRKKMKEKARDKVLVVDLECSCWRGHPPEGQRQEIIEIGICMLDVQTREITNKQGILVKNHESEISKFCTQLTSITQEMIDKDGVEFDEACEILKTYYNSAKRVWFSWGNFDRTQLVKDCLHRGVEYPMSDYHFNAKTLYGLKYKMKREPGVQSALKHAGMKFEGTHHRGVDDAVNIARLLERVFDGPYDVKGLHMGIVEGEARKPANKRKG